MEVFFHTNIVKKVSYPPSVANAKVVTYVVTFC